MMRFVPTGVRWVVPLLLAALQSLSSCGADALPPACTTSADCPSDTTCSLKTHMCEAALDAAIDDLHLVSGDDLREMADLVPGSRCQGDRDCTAPAPRCDLSSGMCVRCLPANDNCPHGQRCALSGGQWTCVDACQVDMDCQGDGGPKRSCCTGLCIDTTQDSSHCGACGRSCPVLAHTRFACAAGVCRIDSCDPGWGACSGNPADGCSTDVTTNLNSCGGCGKVCGGPNAQHANATCAMGVCTLQCNLGFADCNRMAADGCEADLLQDNANCGGCGQPCGNVNHQMSVCKMGACLPGACEPGWTDCTGDMKNPCNTYLGDPNHCGSCNTVCPPMMNAMPGCGLVINMYKCMPGMCLPGWGDCDKNAGNGCEKSVLADVKNCGACGKVCQVNGDVPECVNGKCGYSMCLPGNVDCNGDRTDGCESDPMYDPMNCGGCGKACPGGPNGAPACVNGKCALACMIGFLDCDKMAQNGCETNEDAKNCGSCGFACPSGPHEAVSCKLHDCNYVCDMGWAACDNQPSRGCLFDLNNDAKNCGKCGTACTYANAAGNCMNGLCKLGACNAGFGDCDGNAGNGCEVNVNTDDKNCGKCGMVCGNNTHCVNGQCSGAPRLLLLGSEPDKSYYVDVQANLKGTGAFSLVDVFDGLVGTPTLQQLQAYDVVLVWTNPLFKDPKTVGDNLADYWDGGGRVVLAGQAVARSPVSGRFGLVANGYVLINPLGYTDTAESLGMIVEPMSPLVANVQMFSTNHTFRSTGGTINGGIVVAKWSPSGAPLIVRGVVKGRNRVDLNLMPVSNVAASMGGGLGSWVGDGAILLKNALLYQ